MNLFRSWKSHFHVLLLHPTEAKVLIIVNSNQDYFLPQIKINQRVWSEDFDLIKNSIEQEFGTAVNVLHYAEFKINKKQKEFQGIYVLEPNNPSEEINNGIWCDSETLANISFPDSEQKSIVETYLKELETGNVPQLRPPWARIGWYDKATNWINQELAKIECQQLTPIECVKNWSISCVLKVKTTAGNLYLKQASTLPLFCDEPVVTQELASLFPNNIPKIISINREHHWLLLQDFGEPIGDKVSLEIKQNIYCLLAQIQIKSIENCDRLLAIGCLDRRLKCLQSQIDPLIENAASLPELSREEISQLQSLAPTLKNLCLELGSYNIPETLVHGDLHLGNVAVDKGNYILFDWTDSCITHPFFDLFDLFFTRSRKSWLKPFNTFWKQHSLSSLRDTYLSQWLEYESPERLLKAWEIAKPLCALHHSVTYQYIIATLEPRTKHELSRALPNFLREVIRFSL